jgi:hypothetical protein
MRIWRQRDVVWMVPLVLGLALAAQSAAAAPSPTGRDAGAAPAQTVSPGHIVVRGRIFYIDRNSDRNHPGAGLRIEVYDKDERAFGAFELLDTTVTDDKGFFESKEILNVDPDGPTGSPEGTQDIFLKLYTDNGTVSVYETGTSQPFAWTSYQIDERDGLVRNVPDGVVGLPPLYVMENTRNVEALWTYVNLVEGWLYLKTQTARDPGKVTAYWSTTSADGPRYDPATRAIYLRDADAGFADVVVQQEAYALVHNAYGTLPGGWTGCTAGPVEDVKTATGAACAFAQGFATFYPLAVYGETEFESLALRALDLDLVGPTTPGWASGDTVPGRIAGALWDLQQADTTEEQYDRFNATFADIWQVMAQRQPDTMRAWWQGWIALGKDACGALGSLFQNTIDYNTAPRVSAVPDIVLDEDTSVAVDLGAYVTDAECDNDSLTYQITSVGAVEAGVSLVPTSVISITPRANWFGTTTVVMRVSDGPATVPFSVRVVVRSVNDCPEVTERIDMQQVRHGQPIVLDLLRHAEDVEDQPFQLRWGVELEPQDEQDVTVSGAGTTTLTFELKATVIASRNVRAVLTVTDRDGCVTRQPVFLSWTARPNKAPAIFWNRLTREYTALMNTDIMVDMRGVADDEEDGPANLEWRVITELTHAGWGYEQPDSKQILRFRPHPDFLGKQAADLQVADSTGATSPLPPETATITLTWVSRAEFDNLPPYILKNKLIGKTVGKGATACYDLADKAEDPDDPQSSLRWFIVNYDGKDVEVAGQGTRRLCISPTRQRLDFEGCMTHEFVVQDPKAAESEPYDVTTCWRTIRVLFPYVSRTR